MQERPEYCFRSLPKQERIWYVAGSMEVWHNMIEGILEWCNDMQDAIATANSILACKGWKYIKIGRE